MRLLLSILLLLPFMASAQDYRLAYDPATVPELYNTTSLTLQQRSGSAWTTVARRVRFHSSEAEINGKTITYSPEQVQRTGGKINVTAQVDGRDIPLTIEVPVLQSIRYRLYTDSIKPILNYYVNVEGVFSSGKVYPLSSNNVTITADIGTMRGMEWEAPADKRFDKVTFRAEVIGNPALSEAVTVYRQRYIDPRDALDYGEQMETMPQSNRRWR